jgi:Flp pilus assembly protein TadB
MADDLRHLPAVAALGEELRRAAEREEARRLGHEPVSLAEADRRARASLEASRARRGDAEHPHRWAGAAAGALVLVLVVALLLGLSLSSARHRSATTSTVPVVATAAEDGWGCSQIGCRPRGVVRRAP